MSLYHVQKLFYHLLVDPKVKQRFQNDCDATLLDYRLTPEEVRAIQAFDLAALYRMGVHPLLLRPFSGLKGMAMPEYLKAIAGGAEGKLS
jgi:hypothetical protein